MTTEWFPIDREPAGIVWLTLPDVWELEYHQLLSR